VIGIAVRAILARLCAVRAAACDSGN
jgi:hypothetical protein